MILLCGIPTESPLQMVRTALDDLRVHYLLFNQRSVARTAIEFTIRQGTVSGRIESENATYQLEDFGGVYLRFMDDRFLPEIKDEPEDSPLREHSRAVHDTLMSWIEIADARVVNRPSAMSSNNSKPYQAQLIIANGLSVPETLVTNDPDLVRAFHKQHRRIIYKSISGVRSIVQEFADEDLARLESVRWCPTQFQKFIVGQNVRVHVVGDRVFPTRIVSDAIDYRYAQKQVGDSAELVACELPPNIADRCIAVAHALDLPFAGIDLKITPSGDVFCFEVNPCPGFSYYEANTGQPIARAVAEYLTRKKSATLSSSLLNVKFESHSRHHVVSPD